MSKVSFPKRNQLYTTAMLSALPLRDQAFLQFYGPGDEAVVIQDTWEVEQQCDGFTHWANLCWRFIRETDEWIPLFVICHPDGEDYSEEETQEFMDKYLVIKYCEHTGDALYYPREVPDGPNAVQETVKEFLEPKALQPHQERVIVERDELKTKISALEKFVAGATFKGIPLIEQESLWEQLTAMNKYLEILEERIARF